MIWLIIWLVGFLILFFAPMVMGDMELVNQIINKENIFIPLAIFWPVTVFAIAFVFVLEYGGKGFVWCYMWPTKKMAAFWAKRRTKN